MKRKSSTRTPTTATASEKNIGKAGIVNSALLSDKSSLVSWDNSSDPAKHVLEASSHSTGHYGVELINSTSALASFPLHSHVLADSYKSRCVSIEIPSISILPAQSDRGSVGEVSSVFFNPERLWIWLWICVYCCVVNRILICFFRIPILLPLLMYPDPIAFILLSRLVTSLPFNS